MSPGMNDDDDNFDLDALRASARAATPRPDAARQTVDLRLAQENFDRLQGSQNAARLTSERPPKGLLQGVRVMLTTLTSRGGLTVTTALVACGVLFLTPYGQTLLRGGNPLLTEADQPADLRVDPAAPGDTAPGDTAPGDTALGDTALGDTALGDTALGDTAPGDTAPGDTAPGDTAPGAEQRLTTPSPQQTAAAPDAPAQDATLPVPGVALRGLAADDGSVVAESDGLAAGASEPFATIAPMPAAPMATDRIATNRIAADGTLATAPNADTEAFANAEDNPLKVVADTPVSTFSIDVDTASYAIIRQSLNAGQLPPPDAVRVEEMVNYFPYDYPAPGPEDGPFRSTVTVLDTPWNSGTELVHIALQGRLPAIADRPPLNLVFLIDTSGSMDDPSKLPLLKQSFRLMLDNLRPEDQVAIVAYAGSSGLVLPPTAAVDRQAILTAMGNLAAGGGTNGQGGLEQAYAVAAQMATDGEVARVILATDGDFNVGLSGTTELTAYVEEKRETGVFLSVLGFGRGNLDDATMQALAQNGNGIAAYIDTLNEAQKVLVDQLTGALFAIAADVKVQVEFNPAVIAEYRLIGYETRALLREDFNNDAVDAAEIGAGLSVTAIYEVTPVGSAALMTDPLRYGDDAGATAPQGNEIGFLRLRWKEPGATDSQLLETPILLDGPTASAAQLTEARFAVAVAGMGQLLRDTAFLRGWGWDEVIALAAANRGADAFGYRNEAVRLMRLAQSLSAE